MSTKIGDFHAFAYKLGGSSLVRYLFLKEHEGKDGDIKPSDRTLYILNVPQYLNVKCLNRLFLNYGSIEKIYIHSKPTCGEEMSHKSSNFDPSTSKLGSKVSYVVFTKPSSLKKVLKESDVKIVPRKEFQSNVGKSKWSNDYNKTFVNVKKLEGEIKEFMTEFDKKAEEEKKKEKIGEADEEGWVTVSKYSKKPKIPRIESASSRIIAKQNAARAKQAAVKFYKNQLRDAKFEQILELRKGFQKDKEQIAMMKARRRFKPF